MAKAKTKRTTPLKAKSVRRAAPKRKATNGCPILPIARRVQQLGDALEDVRRKRKQSEEPDEGLVADENNIHDAFQHTLDRSSYLTPKSAAGAAALLAWCFNDAGTASRDESAAYRARLFRRVERWAYALRRYFERQPGVDFVALGVAQYMSSANDPEFRVSYRVG